MMVQGLWKVTGRRPYRGNEPGEEFEAALDNNVARRAVDRGDIVLLEEYVPTVPDGYRLPEGWLTLAT